MFSNHPSAQDLADFFRGGSQSAVRRRNSEVIRHLLAGCPTCRERLAGLGGEAQTLARLVRPVKAAGRRAKGSEPDLPATYDYSRAFAAAESAVSSLLTPEPLETESPASVLAELSSLPKEEQARRVSGGGRFANPAVIRALLDRSHEVRFQDVEEMLHSAHLGRLAAGACSAVQAGDPWRLGDLRARAWGQYGNALRVSGRPREAGEALATAQRYREEGTGDPLLRAWLLERTVPLATFQERFADAIAMCEEAGEVYQEIGDSHLLASTLVQKAIATLYSGEAESAIRILNRALPLIDHEEDPHLLLAACHNLVQCYIALDRPDQALLLYFEARELYQEFDDPLIQLRAAWQEGRLLRDLGHLRAAESALLRARNGYMERKLAYEVAVVSLDLATVYIKLGHVEELKRTVLTMVPIFHALQVGIESLAALLQLQQVTDQEQRALELVRKLSGLLEPLRLQRADER